MFDARRVAQDFSDAALGYDSHASLQHRVLSQLLDRVLPALPSHGRVLDAGCGSGRLARKLPKHCVTQIDIAYAMCALAAPFGMTLNGTLESLPFADNVFDGVVCSFVLQWIDDSQKAIAEMYRVLRPGGVLAMSTFGPGTLTELKDSFASVDNYAHVSPFRVPEEFEIQETITEYYPDMLSLMHHLKNMGARNKLNIRRRSLMTHSQMHKAERYYKEHFATPAGLRVSWDIRTMIAIKP